MKLFNIYIKKSESNTIEDLVAVKSNLSYLAFLFNILWFFQHKMWKESIVFLLINAVFIAIFQKNFFGFSDALIIEFGLLLIVGLNAGYLYEKSLMRKNYQFSGTVFGKNKDEAKLRFISNCFKNEEDQGQSFCPSIINLKQGKNLSQFFTI